MRSRLRPVHGAVAVLLALGCLAGGRLAAQQPATGQPAGQPPAQPRDPRAIILEKLRRLDARRDTARDTTAVRDSTREPFELTAPVPAPRSTGGAPGAAPIQDDSISSALARLQGFTATKYAANSARFDADSERLVLKAGGKEAPAQVIQGDQAMTADSSLVFNQKSQIACGYGNPLLTGAGQSNPVESDLVCYDVNNRRGIAFGAKTKFQPAGQGTAWYVDGHKLYTTGADRVYAREAEFTDCDLAEKGKEPHYHFTASEVKIVKSDVLVARNVVLSFADVPVFWLPFMMQSTAKGRRSGILMPRFDLNDIARTNTNYQRRISNVGFYWAISDHFGELTSMDWFSGQYTAVTGALDWSFRRQFLNGALSVKRYWRTVGTKELTLSANNSWRPDERTSLAVSANFATSSQFVVDQSFDPRELNRSIDSNLSLQRRFNWGSLDFAGSRRQVLQTDRVTWRMPSVSLSLTPITFFKAINWQGSGNYSADQDKANDFHKSHDPSTTARQAGFSSSLNLGKFSWSQSINYNANNQLDRPLVWDTIRSADGSFRIDSTSIQHLLPTSKENVNWGMSLGFQQRLIGTSSISPSLSLSGQSMRLDADTGVIGHQGRLKTGMVAAPVRMNFGVGTQMDVYGFWPGVGPFSRIRHRLSPSFTYAYSPAPSGNITPEQKTVFGTTAGAITEVNQLRIGLNQTFEAKYRETAKDSTAADSAAANEPNDGEPRRVPQARKMMLLSIGTSAVAYDFTQDTLHHRRYGFGTSLSMSNDIRSDLIPGLQFSLQHSIIDTTASGRRRFSPFLTSASTSFGLSDNSWLFRLLGLAAHHGARASAQQEVTDTTPGQTSAADQANSGTGLSIVPHSRREETRTSGGVGSWNAQFTYNLSRQRPDANLAACVPSVLTYCPKTLSTQMIQSRFSFRPTPNWSVGWQTGFNVTDGKFSDHVLTLTRDLHDWEANFDFVKAQNGNFTVQFRVNLKAQPDLKFDYRQASGGGYTPF